MVSRQCLGQKTVVWVMNNSREEAGFDATHIIYFIQVNSMLDFTSISFILCVLHKRDNKIIELDNDQTHTNKSTKAHV